MKRVLFCGNLLLLVVASCCEPAKVDYEAEAWRRADSLVQLLTLEEKAQLTMDFSKPVERLGIKQYNWWNEALHGVSSRPIHCVSILASMNSL